MRTYGRLLASPATTVSLVAALIGAIPIGMWPLTIVLGALDGGGTAADAGVLAAVFGVGNAVGVVSQGALLGRVRAALLLPLFAALGVVAVALQAGGAVLAGAALAGVAIPAVTPAVRGRLAISLPGADRPGAYALVNVLFQAGIAIGPLLAAALASAGLVGVAPAIAATGGLLGAGLLAVAHRGRPERAIGTAAARAPAAGALVLIAAAGAAGFGIGTLQVLVPVRTGPATSGAAFALLALAEVAGAVLLGGRAGSRHAFRMLVLGTAGMAALYVLLQLGVAPVPAAFALGLATAVQSLGSALGLDRFVPPARIPAVFAVQVALVILGAAAGSFTAGVLPGAAFAVAAALLVAAGAAVAGLAGRPVLRAAGPGASAR